jgi:ribosomal protein S18 acetylase RimI-like enzyme
LNDIELEYTQLLTEIINDRYLNNLDMSYLLAFREEKLVGIAAFTSSNCSSTLHEIFVMEHQRSNGIGEQLMVEFEACSQNTVKQLSVLSENEGAINFYRRLGYEVINDPSSIIKMEKE